MAGWLSNIFAALKDTFGFVKDIFSVKVEHLLGLGKRCVSTVCENASVVATSANDLVSNIKIPNLRESARVICEFLGISEWWELEHTVLLVWFVLFAYFFYQRSSGNYQEIALQFTSGLSTLMMLGCHIRLIYGV